MRIELEERTCPVCGAEHADHVIDGKPDWTRWIWDHGICNKCDEWALATEFSMHGPMAGKLITRWGAGIGGPGYLRGRLGA